MNVRQRYLASLTACFTPDVARRIIEFCPDDVTKARLLYLRERANEGILSDSEQAEYEQFVDAIDFVGVLKSEALRALQSARH